VRTTVFQILFILCKVFFTASFDGVLIFEHLLVEIGEDMRRVHEDGQSAGQRYDGVNVEEETVYDQRDILPVINHLSTVKPARVGIPINT